MTVSASRFRAMNTDIALLAPTAGPDFEGAADLVGDIFREIENRLSRFRDESELCALNAAQGSPFRASPLLFQVVCLAVQAARASDGVFDPTVLTSLEHAGYDRSFERLTEGRTPRSDRDSPSPDYRSVQCDPRTRTIRLTAGHRLDLGGIGKGYAVDRALAATAFLGDRMIAAGGDVAARGRVTLREPWTVELEDTGDLGPRTITLRDAAVATSTTLRRRWERGGHVYHHLIDPRTGRPSISPLRTVTVVAPTCVQADVGAKTALLLGERGMDFLDERGLHGFGVRLDGSTVGTSQWPGDGL